MKRKWLSVLLLALVLILAFGTAVQAQTKTLYWQRYDVDLSVQKNGDLRVVETQELVFTSGTFQYGQRDILLNRLGAISAITVQEQGGPAYTQSTSGAPNTYNVTQGSGQVSVRYNFPPTTDARRTIVIGYTVSQSLRYYPATNVDQLNWIAIPSGNPFPSRSSTLTLHLPDGATFTNYVVYGAKYQATFQPGQKDATLRVTQQMDPGTNVEVVAEWQPHGLVSGSAQPWQLQLDAEAAQKAQQAQMAPVLNLLFGSVGILLAVGGPVLLYLLWYRRGRDAPVGLIADYLPEAPSDLPAGMVGTLVDESADLKDILATILDLARRGVLEIQETEEPGFLGIGSHRDFTYRLKNNTLPLRTYEKTLISALFGGSSEVQLSELKNKFYPAVPKLRRQLFTEVVQEGFFKENPETTRTRYGCMGVAVLIVAGLAAFLMLGAWGDIAGLAICPGLGLGLTAVGLIILARYMPRKTEPGADAAARWKAFQRYLANLEKYTKVEDAKGIFDRYLPYAVAFGLEKSWIARFARVDTPAPIWWIPSPMHHVPDGGMGRPAGVPVSAEGGPAPSLSGMSRGMGNSLAGMSVGLGAMLSSAGSTLTSQPSSSGGSGGSSGGGFSGGGGSSGGGSGGGGSSFG